MENILVYDIEVFKYDSFVIFLDENDNFKLFHDKNSFEGLSDYIKGKTLVSYNGYFYDDHILCAMLDKWSQAQIKELNDRIIGGEKQRPKNRFRSLDCFQQIDVSMPGLKKLEANRGVSIIECEIPFDIDRPLTKDEYKEAVKYCQWDVTNTKWVYQMREKSYFESKLGLVDMLGKGLHWNTTTLAANVLLGNKTLPKWSDIRLSKDWHDLSMLDLAPPEVVEFWKSGKDKGKVTIEAFDNKFEFGLGGLHSVNTKQKVFKNVKLLDVASLYPNIILNINGLGNSTEKYKSILEERMKIKHVDKVRSDALKLILNSTYGNLKNQYSSLYNPMCALSVCVYGQIVLYELCKRMSEVSTIVQANTDGIAFVPHADYDHIWKQWEKDFNLILEEDSFDLFIQKDVNNYIGVKNGKVKVKGGDVGKYEHPSYFKNNNARICDIALVDHLLYGKSVIDTLIENLDKPELYMYIIQAGGTYQGTFDAEGNKFNKVNRIFPTKKKDAICLYKKKHDGGLVRFPDLPERMHVHNDDCSKIENFERWIDLNHYLMVINKKLDRWK
jgi:hypothetical protein